MLASNSTPRQKKQRAEIARETYLYIQNPRKIQKTIKIQEKYKKTIKILQILSASGTALSSSSTHQN
jgi:hypothetical protein